MRPEIRRYPNLEDLSRAAAEYISELARTAVTERGIFSIVLSGGKTPQLLYETLAKRDFSESMPWQQTHLFWGDERFVPPDHPDSNFAMAFHTLISRVPVPSENVHKIPTETDLPETAASEYEQALREFFQNHGKSGTAPGLPAFDLVLLGMGQDGHTASLFPDDAALAETSRWVVAVSGSKGSLPVPRITLTYPLINQAKCVLLLASGSEKRDVLQRILDSPETAAKLYPVARVQPSGSLLWFLDRELT